MNTVHVESNINDVINSVDDVQDDIWIELHRRVSRIMSICEQRARVYVQKDSDYTGKLYQAIKSDNSVDGRTMQFRVFTDSDIAPYAAIVEFGSGQRGAAGKEWTGSERAQKPDQYPPDYPYDPPDISYDQKNPRDLTGHSDFAGFVNYIQVWMRKKPVQPLSGDIFTSAVAIAKSIIEKGNFAHPFMRPAWYDTELRVKKAAVNAVRNATR